MKKILASILAFTLVISLCACGSGTQSSSPKVSVNVQTLSQNCYSDDGKTLLLEYSDGVPNVTIAGNEAASTAINSALQEISTSYANGSGEYDPGIDGNLAAAKAEFADRPEAFTGDEGIHYAMERDVDVSRGDEAVLSFAYGAYSFSGGAHGYYAVSGENFDSATGNKLGLADITDNAKGLTDFCVNYIKNDIKTGNYEENMFNPDYEDSIPNIVADGFWYFTDEGLAFVANAYELASYAAGAFTFTVPYSKLGELLKSQYLPVERAGDTGDMTAALTENPVDESTVGSVVIESEGEKFTLTAKGTIYDVTLSDAMYNEYSNDFSANGTRLYFSDLSNGQSIGVQTYIPDAIPNLMISWRNADGSVEKRTISQSGEDGSIILADISSGTDLNPIELTDAMPYSFDIDLDGSDEVIELKETEGEDPNTPEYAVFLTDSTVGTQFDSGIISDVTMWLADVDGDGMEEILFSGNVMSDDYVTYCLRYANGKLTPIKFTGETRANIKDADCFYGSIKTVGSDGIALEGVCDVLGSYSGVKTFEYSDGSLHPVADSVWIFTGNEQWITVKSAVPATADNGEASTLPVGAKIQMTSSDGATWVKYTDGSGVSGTIELEANPDYWGFYINGQEDSTYFDALPYAG